MGYKKDVVTGISWIGFLRLFTKALGFIEAIILARILAPEQFGAYGVALLALGLLEVFTESGINIILVQEKDVDKYISSAWIVSVVRGMAIMTFLLFSAPFIADFFHTPESLRLLYWISLVPFIRGFINPSIIKFQKNLMFAKDFWFRMTILLIDTLVSIIVTYLTQNPIGIIIGLLAGVIVELLFSFILVSPRPKFEFEKKYIKVIFNRGKWVTFSSIFDYLFHNADNIIVGKLLGARALGVYQLAYSLSAAPLIEVGRVFVHVTVPIMIKIADEPLRLKDAYFKTIFNLFIITLPIALIFSLFPHFFVLILGREWAEIGVVLPILGVVGFVKSVSLASTALFLSLKKQEYTAVITLVNILALSLSIIPLILSYGILGAGFSALIGSLCAVPFIIYYTQKTFSNLIVTKK